MALGMECATALGREDREYVQEVEGGGGVQGELLKTKVLHKFMICGQEARKGVL